MSSVFRVEKSSNFTVMANFHLKDRRLSYKAKGLLSEMLSLPPDWDYSLYGLALIAADGIDGVRTGIKELEKFGYVVRGKQLRDENGRLSVNEYFVYENPTENPNFNADDTDKQFVVTSKGSIKAKHPALENPTTVENQEILNDPSLENPTTGLPSTENPTTVTYNKLNTHVLNNNKSISSSSRAEARENWTDGWKDFEQARVSDEERAAYTMIVKEHLEIDYYERYSRTPLEKHKLSQIKHIMSIMLDVICSNSSTIRVNGEHKKQSEVKDRFLSLTDEHICYVLDAMRENPNPVKNMRSFLITALYNAPDTIDDYYEAMYRRDMGV